MDIVETVETSYDMNDTAIKYSDPDHGDYELVEVRVEEGDVVAELYVEGRSEENGEIVATIIHATEVDLLALIAAAERALDIIRDNS